MKSLNLREIEVSKHLRLTLIYLIEKYIYQLQLRMHRLPLPIQLLFHLLLFRFRIFLQKLQMSKWPTQAIRSQHLVRRAPQNPEEKGIVGKWISIKIADLINLDRMIIG